MVPHDSTKCIPSTMCAYRHDSVHTCNGDKDRSLPSGAWSPLGEQTTQQATTTRHENPGMGEGQGCQDLVEFSGIRSGWWEEVALGLGNSRPVRAEGRQAQLTQGLVSHRTALNIAVT